MRRAATAVVVGFVATLVPLASVPPRAGAAPVDIYAFANGCYALQDDACGRFVSRDTFGFLAGATSAAGATPFRLQATALGRYLFYGTGGKMISVGLLNSIPSTTTPGPSADWALTDVGGKLRITSVSNGKSLGVGILRRLGQSTAVEARWSLLPTQGCAVFPEIEVNATGTPLANADPDAPVRGFLDSHTRQRVRVPRRRLRLGQQRARCPARPTPRQRRESRDVSLHDVRWWHGHGQQHSGTRVYDVNIDGVAHYGLFPDYIEDLRMLAGDQIVDDLANGAEAYLQMWERAISG